VQRVRRKKHMRAQEVQVQLQRVCWRWDLLPREAAREEQVPVKSVAAAVASAPTGGPRASVESIAAASMGRASTGVKSVAAVPSAPTGLQSKYTGKCGECKITKLLVAKFDQLETSGVLSSVPERALGSRS
jgi:hypothetical protein